MALLLRTLEVVVYQPLLPRAFGTLIWEIVLVVGAKPAKSIPNLEETHKILQLPFFQHPDFLNVEIMR